MLQETADTIPELGSKNIHCAGLGGTPDDATVKLEPSGHPASSSAACHVPATESVALSPAMTELSDRHGEAHERILDDG